MRSLEPSNGNLHDRLSQAHPVTLNDQSSNPSRQVKARVGVVEHLYYQPGGGGGQPRDFPTTFFRWIDSEEMPYERTMRVTETWVELDCGWLSPERGGRVGMVKVVNHEGQGQTVIPTEQEKATINGRVVVLGVLAPFHTLPIPFAVILPSITGEDIRFTPMESVRYFLRVAPGSGTAKVTVTALPT